MSQIANVWTDILLSSPKTASLMSGGQQRWLYSCDCELFMPAHGTAGRLTWPSSVFLHGMLRRH